MQLDAKLVSAVKGAAKQGKSERQYGGLCIFNSDGTEFLRSKIHKGAPQPTKHSEYLSIKEAVERIDEMNPALIKSSNPHELHVYTYFSPCPSCANYLVIGQRTLQETLGRQLICKVGHRKLFMDFNYRDLAEKTFKFAWKQLNREIKEKQEGIITIEDLYNDTNQYLQESFDSMGQSFTPVEPVDFRPLKHIRFRQAFHNTLVKAQEQNAKTILSLKAAIQDRQNQINNDSDLSNHRRVKDRFLEELALSRTILTAAGWEFDKVYE